MTLFKKNKLAASPSPATTNEMILYSHNLSDINLKIRTPIPNTTKLEIKVNVFLKLLSLSFDNKKITLLFLEQVSEGTKLI